MIDCGCGVSVLGNWLGYRSEVVVSGAKSNLLRLKIFYKVRRDRGAI